MFIAEHNCPSVACVASIGSHSFHTTIAHTPDQFTDCGLRDDLPFILKNPDQLPTCSRLPPGHTTTEDVPKVFDGVKVWGIRHPIEHLDLLVVKEIPSGSSSVRPGSVLLEYSEVWVSCHEGDDMRAQDEIDVSLCRQIPFNND